MMPAVFRILQLWTALSANPNPNPKCYGQTCDVSDPCLANQTVNNPIIWSNCLIHQVSSQSLLSSVFIQWVVDARSAANDYLNSPIFIFILLNRNQIQANAITNYQSPKRCLKCACFIRRAAKKSETFPFITINYAVWPIDQLSIYPALMDR